MHLNCTPEIKNRSTGTLKVHPGLAAAALKRKHTAEYALWLMARSIDAGGSGRVRYDDLRQAAADLAGWSDFKFRRVIRKALQDNWMLRSGEIIFLRSLEKVATSLEIRSLGARSVSVPIEALARLKHWREALLKAWHAGRSGYELPISQAAVEAVTGLTPRTQYTYLKKGRRRDTTIIHNYARRAKKFKATLLAGVREFVPGAYMRSDGSLWQTLPNTTLVSEEVYPIGKRGNLRKVNIALNAVVNCAAAQQETLKTARKYHDGKIPPRESVKKTYKAIGRGKRRDPGDMFMLRRVISAKDVRTGREVPLAALWELV